VAFGHCEVDLFFVFSSGILGETKQNKSAKVAIFTEFVFGDHQKKTKQDFMKFLFSRLAFNQFSPSYDFPFFFFLFLFSKDFFFSFFYSSSFLEQIQAKNPKINKL
jgi:hypothetical protein